MSDDKLVKNSTTIETAEAFAKAIGRAIGENDVETAAMLSGELREKLEGEMCVCGHSRAIHSLRSDAELPANGTGTCLNTSPELRQCTCRGFVSAVREERTPSVRSIFNEGKHLCKLRAVWYESAATDNPLVCFKLEAVKSRQMAPGVESVHALPVRTNTQKRAVLGLIQRLGIDPLAINGMLDNIDLDVVVVSVVRSERVPAMVQPDRPRTWTSITIRRPDDGDEPWDDSW